MVQKTWKCWKFVLLLLVSLSVMFAREGLKPPGPMLPGFHLRRPNPLISKVSARVPRRHARVRAPRRVAQTLGLPRRDSSRRLLPAGAGTYR